MGLDYICFLVVPRAEAVGAWDGIKSLAELRGWLGLIDTNDDEEQSLGQLQAEFDDPPVTMSADTYVKLDVPRDDIGTTDVPQIGQITATFTLKAVTTRCSRVLADSPGFLAAIREVARRSLALYCGVDRENLPMRVVCLDGQDVDEEIPLYHNFHPPPHATIARMIREIRIERRLRHEVVADARGVVQESAIDRNEEVRVVVARILAGDVLGSEESRLLLVRLLNDSSSSVREEAARSLGLRKEAHALDELHEVVTDAVPAVRRAVLQALGNIGAEQSVPVIAQGYHDSETGREAADAMCKIEGLGSNSFLIAWLAEPDYNSMRRNANVIGAVGRRQLREAVPLLCAGLANIPKDRLGLGCVIVDALGLIGDPAAIEPCARLLRIGDGLTRCSVVWAFHNIGDERALPHLKRRLRDSDHAVREAARDAINEIKAKPKG